MNYKKLFGVVLLAVLTSNSYGQLFYKITSPQKRMFLTCLEQCMGRGVLSPYQTL
jgi:hypothetical protein